jgi:hypothetical protein
MKFSITRMLVTAAVVLGALGAAAVARTVTESSRPPGPGLPTKPSSAGRSIVGCLSTSRSCVPAQRRR